MLDRALISSMARRSRAFTLVELLVVITIIVVLIGILLPTVHKVRIYAQGADTKNWVNELSSAIERYQQDFKAYPGPLANNEMDLGDAPTMSYYPVGNTNTVFPGGFKYPTPAPTGYDLITETAAQASLQFTMSQNLVLGLLGGFYIDPASVAAGNPALDYDPSAIGTGPASLSTVLPPKRYPPYLDSKQLSWQVLDPAHGKIGHYFDDGAAANDSLIPTFLDRFVNPMPILYMRAKVGASPQTGQVTALAYSKDFNPIVTDDFTEMMAPTPTGFAIRAGQYDISQIIAYTGAYNGSWPTSRVRDTAIPPTGTSIGIGKTLSSPVFTVPPGSGGIYHGLQMQAWTGQYPPTTPSLTSQYPYDAYPYLVGTGGQVREKDGYILISAGPDRIYGTSDDICSFGTAGQ